jgi:hypothetical protein
MKRVVSLLWLLLACAPAFAEAFKNDSPGGILTAIFVLLVGVPAAVGLGVYALMHLSNQEYTANKTVTVFASCAGWWAMLFFAFGSRAGGGVWLLAVGISAGMAALAYHSSRKQNPDY